MKKSRIGVVGYGNVGREAVAAIEKAPDMELAAVVRRSRRGSPAALPVVTGVEELEHLDAVLLTIPSPLIPETAPLYLQKGINTVDGYDIHGEAMLRLRKLLDGRARESGRVAVIGAGWDPGTDSIFRMLFTAIAPLGITYTDFGPGMSMGHSATAGAVSGVRKAFSVTLPLGYGEHRRDVYVELEEGADLAGIAAEIKNNPYFRNDPTTVIEVDDLMQLKVAAHGVRISRCGSSGTAQNQLLELQMKLTNPAATAQIMVAAARASLLLKPGCYVLGEIPPIDLLPRGREEIIKKMV